MTSIAAGTGLAGGTITKSGTLSIASAGVTNAMLQNSSLTVSPGTGLTGGGSVSLGGSTTLNLDTSQVPLLVANNSFTGNQTVNGNLSATGVVTGNSFQIGSNLFDYGSYALSNASLGFAGNTTMTGGGNTATGWEALLSNQSGNFNTASGEEALYSNTTGGFNTASGSFALVKNTTGNDNTTSGFSALDSNTTGSDNTATGFQALIHNTSGCCNTANGSNALFSNTVGTGSLADGYQALYFATGSNNTGLGTYAGNSTNSQLTTGSANTYIGYQSNSGTQLALNNATAIGANSEVDESNAMVLGSINGVNGASASTNVGIGTTTPAATLDVHGTGNFTGLITFAPGQTFPGTGTITGVTPGTALTGGGGSGNVTLNVDTTKVVTGVVAGTDLTGGGTGGVQTLNLDTSKVPLLIANNTFIGNQAVTGNLSASGVVTGSSYQIGSNLFAFGSYAQASAFFGFAGNTTTSGDYNTASGYQALYSNTTGYDNTASGYQALYSNTTGWDNTASGPNALYYNTAGSDNTGSGRDALLLNTIGSFNTADGRLALSSNSSGYLNTASGADALVNNTTGSLNTGLGYFANVGSGALTNATAIGATALVTSSNAMVLGSINGVNGATANTNVGIGTTSPTTTLHVVSSSTYQPVLVQTPSTFGTWLEIGNTSSGGHTWNILSAGSGNAEGVGNLGITDLTGKSLIWLEGNVDVTSFLGIGLSNPTLPLEVAQGKGNAIADGWTTYSSRRWKANIHELPDALSKVERLRGVSYDLKDSGKHEIGVIAEEVGEVVPEVVSYEKNGKDAQGVDYSRLTALLIEAVKQQQKQIAALRSQLRTETLKGTRLESRLTQLEKQREDQSRLASAKPSRR